MKNNLKFSNAVLIVFTILTLTTINYSYGFGTGDYITGGQFGDDSGQSQSQGESTQNSKPGMGGGMTLTGDDKKDDVQSTEYKSPIKDVDGIPDESGGTDKITEENKKDREEAEKGSQAGSDAVHQNDTIYQQPERDKQNSASGSLDDMMKDADSFVTQGNLQYDPSKLVNFSQNVYNIALTIGTVIAVLMGAVLGIKFMMGSAEEKADTKKLLVAYVVGCIIVFGGFGIWKIVTTILSNM